jgi:hypothetical protein
MNVRLSVIAILVAALPGIAQADFCDYPNGQECPIDKYLTIRKSENNCPSDIPECILNTKAPGIDQIACSQTDYGYICNVWPLGPGLSYTYHGTGNLVFGNPGPTADANVDVGCVQPWQQDTLTVTVTSPHGLSSSSSLVLGCEPSGFVVR